MGENKVTSSYIPVADNDLVNKKYIDALTTGETSALVLASKLDSKFDKSGGIITGNIDLGVNKITSSFVALTPYDIPNKEYIDNGLAHRLDDNDIRIFMNNLSLKVNKTDQRFVKNNVGYVPDLDKNLNNKSGFSVTASSEAPPVGRQTFSAHNVFCSWKGLWNVLNKTSMWIKIQCPEKIRIHKYVIKCSDTGTDTILNWKVEASNDDVNWVTLYEVPSFETIQKQINHMLLDQIRYFDITNNTAFSYFRVSILQSLNNNPGLSYFQLYTLDEVVTL